MKARIGQCGKQLQLWNAKNNKITLWRKITKLVQQLGWCEPSSPASKELHCQSLYSRSCSKIFSTWSWSSTPARWENSLIVTIWNFRRDFQTFWSSSSTRPRVPPAAVLKRMNQMMTMKTRILRSIHGCQVSFDLSEIYNRFLDIFWQNSLFIFSITGHKNTQQLLHYFNKCRIKYGFPN